MRIRTWRSPPAGTGSASCKRASSRATTLPPSRRRRRPNGCSGPRRHSSSWQSTISTPRWREPRFAIRPAPRSGPATWRRWPLHHRQLQEWAENCPENFANRAALVAAEIARLEGRELDAERLYEQAIRSARANGFVHNEALANELAARFYAARGFEKIAHAYLRDARYGYLRWGADGKVRQLEQLYPHLRDGRASACSHAAPSARPSSSWISGRCSRPRRRCPARSSSVKLIKTLLRIAIEHAGAERGLLILFPGDEPRIAAEATTGRGQVEVTLRQTAVSPAELPESVLHYVIRTRESVILDDASAQNPFSADEYICQKHARSVLCLPLVKQAKLIGVLYLENNLASHVFTPARISVLELLASQAAISLENARLYSDLQEREARIRRLVDSNIIGIMIWDFHGRIIEANEAFLDMVGYGREDLVSGRLRWTELTPAEWRDADEQDHRRAKGDRNPPARREGVLSQRWQPRAGSGRRSAFRLETETKAFPLSST